MAHTDTLHTNSAGFVQPHGLYDPRNDHDSCGVGFVAKLDAVPSHDLVQKSIQVLVNLEHRGAVGGDKKTGDGAGLLLQFPEEFLRAQGKKLSMDIPGPGEYGVGMLFLPSDPALADRAKAVVETSVTAEGCTFLGWRDVPVEADDLGVMARSTMPAITQAYIGRGTIPVDQFERKLYVIRRVIENIIESWTDADFSQFYISSLSSRTIVYKGLLTGTQLEIFFPDLQDELFKISFSIVHQRYSTNTLPTWSLAQPFRYLAHNGEINTLRGNVNRMRSLSSLFSSPLFNDDIEKIKPIIVETGSDSAMMDNAMELLTMAGRSLPHAAMMMVPEAWGQKYIMSDDKRAFYEYHSSFMEPWDGPSALVITDGRYIGAILDRNGLRPARYTVTRDGLVLLASETGVIDFPAETILKRGRLQPGKMFLVDLEQHRIVPDNEIKARVSRQKPYRHWVRDNHIQLRGLHSLADEMQFDTAVLRRQQHLFGYTEEELKMIIAPMASRGQEPVGSMGNDAALAILSNRPRLLFDYFKQLFAQVTNPPIDPLREELVMSLMSFIGRVGNLLDETPEHCRQLMLQHPILTSEDIGRLKNNDNPHLIPVVLDMTFPACGDGNALKTALTRLFTQAEDAVADGASILILSDRKADKKNAPIPALLATAGLHHHLIGKQCRTQCAIVVDTGEAREVNHFALLIGFGASAICPYVALTTAREMAEVHLLEKELSPEVAVDSYINAVKKGLLKTLSRMGISTIRSYRGAQIFEAIGLGQDLVDTYFCRTASRIGGIGLDEVAQEVNARHTKAYPPGDMIPNLLETGGDYTLRADGERHLWTPEAIYKLQLATKAGDYSVFKEYTDLIDDQSEAHATLRSLLKFKHGTPVPIEAVESVEEITQRFVTAAMSYGSISKEAHEAIAIAMNRVGGKSNSGEGGEDPERYKPLPNGDSKISRIKQIASGRFGVTSDYLMHADELQIKIAQGAKPGEGGQLPGHKVSVEIARVRHTTPGVTLISPPPHHDIYSIEDLAQLIYDLKSANPSARISVKLVSEVGVGTIASGVAKAKADMVLISGYDGGTGASPLTAIKHCGLPWELGLAETQQSLIANHLRDKIRVQTDGQLKTGRDLAIAILMGAEEFGFGTTVLVTLGCVMMRKCHLNTCPVGVATQDPELRKRFLGKADYVERFMKFIAQELREYMAELGFRTVDDMVGRIEMLEFQPAVNHWKASGLDLSLLLEPPLDPDSPRRCIRSQEHDVDQSLDVKLIEKITPALEKGETISLELPIRNINRTVGAMLSGEITKVYGADSLADDTVSLSFTGSAGQSFGAFLTTGVTMRLEGDTNDYYGKGLSGGKLIVVPPRKARFKAHENVIAGNVCLYGATAGEMYINGLAGERFAIRNSGVRTVVEGVGDHGCEYMTGGVVVVLGLTGVNFAAGMSGGVAYVYDETELFGTRCNMDMVDLETVWHEEDRIELKGMLENHVAYTNSERGRYILDNWEASYPLFVKVMPIDYKRVLDRIALQEGTETSTMPATEEVFDG